MKAKKKVAPLLIFFFSLFLSMVAGEERAAEKNSEVKGKSLIRKELLLKEKKELKPPRRNIFSPQGSGFLEERDEALGVPQGIQETENQPEALSFVLNLRYIGYIDTGQKITALIIFEGEAMAVEVEERISEQITVERITTKEIEVMGPGNEKRRYSLEGEEQ